MRILTISRDIVIRADDVLGNGRPFHNIFELRPEERKVAIHGAREVLLPADAQLTGVALRGLFSGASHMSTEGLSIFDIKVGFSSLTASVGYFAPGLIDGKRFRFSTPTDPARAIMVMFSNIRDIDWCGQVVFSFTDRIDVEDRLVDEICPFGLPRKILVRKEDPYDNEDTFTVLPKTRKEIVAQPQVAGGLGVIYVAPEVMSAIVFEQLAVGAMLYTMGEEGRESRHRRVLLNTTACTDRIVIPESPEIVPGEVLELRISNRDFGGKVGPRQFLLHMTRSP